MPTYVYTLSCSDEEKYFIGSSPSKLRNPIKHFSSQNSTFQFLLSYPMGKVISECQLAENDNIDNKVLEMMQMKGALNVRGGSFMVLNRDTVALLISMNLFKNKKHCLFCKSTLHPSQRCVEYNSDDDSDYVPSDHDDEDDESTNSESDNDNY